jgi:NAD(P)-dependent dehydrogenase (short-subunit alcohol dehydrogenase family)
MDRDVSRDRRTGAVNPKRAIVTGAARGLGEAIAMRLVRDGLDVALLDVSPALKDTAERLAEVRGGARTPAFVGDVVDESFCEETVRLTVAELGGVDVLVNNAGIGGPATPSVETSAADFRRVLDVNLVGAFIMSRAVARVMIDQATGGMIVNIGSIFGQQAIAGDAAYAASKAGIGLLTQALALELAPFSVRVNTIAPGNMATEMHFDYLRALAEERGVAFEAQLEEVRRTIPLGRHGTGDDVAGAIAWLVSPDAAYVTGQTIGVNGGVLLV